MSERWIKIRNWERFQHYSDRDPPWIKNYTALLSDPNYGNLTHAQRSTLHGLWLMYARSSRQLPDDTAWITRQLGVRVTRATLDALNHAGFIEFLLAERYQGASPRARPTEAEAYKEEKEHLPKAVEKVSNERPGENFSEEQEQELGDDYAEQIRELERSLAEDLGENW